MEVTSIKTLNPAEENTARCIVEVTGTVWQYRFGAAEMVKKPLTLYFFWNSVVDYSQVSFAGEQRSLFEIIKAAFNPSRPADQIMPKISGFRGRYMGWNGDRFFFYTPASRKGSEIALRVQRNHERLFVPQ